MKENIIETKVNNLQNLSQRVKEFINQKSNLHSTPFYQQPDIIADHPGKRRPKRSLTDWRQLYEKKMSKIQPKNVYSPSTADGFRLRHAMTADHKRSRDQFQSQKPYSVAYNRPRQTRQSKRFKLNQSKRQNMMQFVFAQTHYADKLMKNEIPCVTKSRQFLQNPRFSATRKDFQRIGSFLQDFTPLQKQQKIQSSATEKYLNDMQLIGNIRVSNYNTAKINEKNKINNERFLQQKGLREKKMLLKGLRYYSRG